MNIQEQLFELYHDRLLRESFDSGLAKKLSPPLLLNVPEYWIQSPVRILYVGQETLGWNWGMNNLYEFQTGGKASIPKLIDGYLTFNFSQSEGHKTNHRAPFWRMFRELRRVTGNVLEGQDTTVLWTNLFRFSFEGESVVKNARKSLPFVQHINRGILNEEIQILQPTHALFVTGPNYDFELEQEFPGIVYSSMGSFNQRQVAAISHPNLPKHSLRAYHPAYSQRSRTYTNQFVTEQVKSWLKNEDI